MATKTKSTKRTKRPRLPGMDDLTIAEIDKAAEAYVEVRTLRMEYLEKEVELNEKVLEKMKKHGLKTYKFDGYQVKVVENQKISVKRAKGDDNGELDDDNPAKAVVEKTAEGMKP